MKKIIIPLFLSFNAFGDLAQILYLIRLVGENIKRYGQIQQILAQGKEHSEYNRWLRQGLDNAVRENILYGSNVFSK